MEDLSEKEQIDAMRTWWSENGSHVIGGVIVGVALIVGWNYWRSSLENTRVAASTLYEEVMSSAGNGNLDAANAAASTLFAEYASTPYAGQARLALARLYMDTGRDADAADALRPLLEEDPDSELALVGRLRLAKILLYQDKAQEAVDLLEGPHEHAFAARYSETLGDAYVALEAYDKAQAAYIAALNDDPVARTVDFNIIQLKLNDLPAIEPVVSSTDLPAEPDLDAAAEVLIDSLSNEAEAVLPEATGEDAASVPENEDSQ